MIEIEGLKPKLVAIKKFEGVSDVMWRLLQEREGVTNISHEGKTTPEEHADFMQNPPYRVWYVIVGTGIKVGAQEGDENENVTVAVGSIYLTARNEIGVFIFKDHQRKGWGQWAVNDLMRCWAKSLKLARTHRHIGPEFYANVNPGNAASIAFFEKLGFGVRQLTLARKAAQKPLAEPKVEAQSAGLE